VSWYLIVSTNYYNICVYYIDIWCNNHIYLLYNPVCLIIYIYCYSRNTDEGYSRNTDEGYSRNTDENYSRNTDEGYCRNTYEGYSRNTYEGCVKMCLGT
jgi:hypothetical protein